MIPESVHNWKLAGILITELEKISGDLRNRSDLRFCAAMMIDNLKSIYQKKESK